MIKIRLLTTYAGPSGSYQAGSVVQMDDDGAKRLITGGFAIKVDPDPTQAPATEVEVTAVEPEQTTEAPKARKPRAKRTRRKSK